MEERQAFLLRLGDALRPLSDPVKLQHVAMRMLGEHLGALRAFYYSVEHEQDKWTCIIEDEWRRSQDQPSFAGRHPVADFGTGALARLPLGETLVFSDARKLKDITPEQLENHLAIKSLATISVPIMKAGEFVGGVTVHSAVPREWTDDEVLLVADVAERSWTAVERARAETALRESEQNFRLFVENVHEYALVQTDFEGIITSWNPGAERLFGYTSTEIVGRPFVMLLPEEDRHEGIITREMAALARSKRNIDAHTVQRKDGSRFWAEWVTEAVLDDTGNLRGTAKVMRDETERQQLEAATRHSLAEKDELLKEVHHRVKNNLQVITSLLNLQAGTLEDKHTLVQFEEARNRVQSIAAIHELLYRSASFASINLRTYTEELIPSLVSFYGMQDRVQTHVHGDDDTTIELERAVPFGLLLNELVSNALKHGFPDGCSGEVRIEIQRANKNIFLRVSDTGIGLPSDFDYANSPTLGLKLVNLLIRQLRGELKVLPATGASFEARFPTNGEPEAD